MQWSSWKYLTTIEELSLTRTLQCGQSFTWQQISNGLWYNALQGGVDFQIAVPVILRENEGVVEYKHFNVPYCSPPDPKQRSEIDAIHSHPTQTNDQVHSLLTDYFQLTYSLPSLTRHWAQQCTHFAELSNRVPGIRLLRQPPVETLFAFICSSNNNIARITQMVRTLCSKYGSLCSTPPLVEDEHGNDLFVIPNLYRIPDVHDLVKQDTHSLELELRSLGFGYRAKFIVQTVHALDAFGGLEWLIGLRKVPYETALMSLLKLPGVGRKVADCGMSNLKRV